MRNYDPHQTPDPEQWLDLDESLRLELVATYHRSNDPDLPNATLHASFHAIVENQLAAGLAEVQNALDRLLNEGLDRHDSVHAIGSVLAEQMYGILKDSPPDGKPDLAYYQGLEKLTAKKWLKSGK
jgi:hypothetical protein